MPHVKNKDLPDRVKNVLPYHGQTVFRKAFNNAFKEYNGNEKSASRVAWSAVKKSGYKKGKNGMWKK